MSRVVAYRIGIAILVVLAFWLLWSLAYEIVVALRWAPERFPSEGSSRWALFAMQNADRSPDFFLMAWRHFYARVMFPPTRLEAFTRAGYAAGVVILLAAGGCLFAFINRRQMPYGAARFGSVMEAVKQGLIAKRGIVLGTLSGVKIGRAHV